MGADAGWRESVGAVAFGARAGWDAALSGAISTSDYRLLLSNNSAQGARCSDLCSLW
jgi:hypothetical protein